MRLILYYMTHTLKNQIKKLFRTWVAVFLLVCMLVGVLFGVGAAVIASLVEGNAGEDSGTEEVVPPEEEPEPLPPETVRSVVELAVGGIVLVILVFSVLTADKSGSSIFLMADVNLLFPAPMKPQAVLLFRLVMQAASSLLLTIYLVFQIPNLIMNLGLGVGAALSMLGAWFFALVYSKLISVLLYTLCASHPALKKRLRPALFAVLAVIAGAYLVTASQAEGGYFAAAVRLFNAPAGWYIPIWGWLKALVMAGFDGAALPAALFAVALLAGAVALIVIIQHIPADFYEDAMARSAETAELQQAAAEGNAALRARKKDRSENWCATG